METLQLFENESCPTSISALLDFLAKTFLLPENEKVLMDGEVLFSMRQLESLTSSVLNILSLRMLRDYSVQGGGADFIEVLQTITNIGYSGQWQLLNTKWFLPQNRERIFFVGHLRGEARPEIFPIGESFESCNGSKVRQTENIAGTINTKNNSPQWQFDAGTTLIVNNGQRYNDLIRLGTVGNDGEGTRIFDAKGLARTIENGGGVGAKTGLYAVSLTEARTENAKEERKKARKNGIDYSARRDKVLLPRQDDNANCLTANQSFEQLVAIKDDFNDEMLALKAVTTNEILKDANIRRLTPLECERLQGFPDGWTEGISDSQRYKCLGNSITVNVAEEIFRRLKTWIDKNMGVAI